MCPEISSLSEQRHNTIWLLKIMQQRLKEALNQIYKECIEGGRENKLEGDIES